jgi:leucyl-tRNA synthetase
LFTQGMVTHETYKSSVSFTLGAMGISPELVKFENGKAFFVGNGDELTVSPLELGEHADYVLPEMTEKRDGVTYFRSTEITVKVGRIEKMSKSKKNVVDPDPMFDQYGADAVRWFMLGDSPPERDLEWSESGIEGTWRFVNRIWRLVDGVTEAEGEDKALDKSLHRAIAGIGADIDALHFNKAVAKVHGLVNDIEKAKPSASRTAAIRTLPLLVAPMLPHLAEEAWAALGNDGLIAGQAWPSHDPALLVDDEVTIAVQVMGKLRDTLTVAKGTPKDTLEALALASEKVQRAMDNATPKKVIVVPDRLVNIVL